jgi:hypothetical protein
MRSRRRYHLPPPVGAKSIVGTGFEFKPEDDLVNAGRPLPPPVELIPVGTPVTTIELAPRDVETGDAPEEGGPPAPKPGN